jgi:adhesin/invasin
MNPVRFTYLVAAIAFGLAACSSDDPGDPGNGNVGPPTSIAEVSGDNQRVLAGEPAPAALVVKVSDAQGNGVSSVAVTWAVTAGGGSTSSMNTMTNSSGEASVTFTTSAEGANTATATATDLTGSPVSFTATAVVPASIDVVSGDGQEARTSQRLADDLIVSVLASDDLPVPGATVDWAVTAGGGSLTSMSSTTGTNGQASVGLTVGSVPGTNTVTADAGTASNASFDATGSAAVVVTVSIGDNFFSAPGGGDDITIMLGDTVRWVNQGSNTHTVTSNATPVGGASFDSGNLGFLYLPAYKRFRFGGLNLWARFGKGRSASAW